MRDFTNLAWPETPFGAKQRPFGRRHHMVCAIYLAGGTSQAAVRSLCVAAVYLRVNPAKTLDVSPATLPVGFRATVAETEADTAQVIAILDRALTRARRHAAILAGNRLDAQLHHLGLDSQQSPAGVTAVAAGWKDRANKTRGLARFVDITDPTSGGQPQLDTEPAQPIPGSSAVDTANAALEQCTAIALLAGSATGRVHWQGTFAVREALHQAGWDILTPHTRARVTQQ